MVAGEASGDLLAGLLLDGLRARWPAMQSMGIGGHQMQARGFEPWWPSETLAVRGYLEVVPHLRRLLAIRRELGDRLLRERPDIFIGIDAPDFNFGLEARLRAAGIPTVHFVSPSFWAWRAKKVETLKCSADHVLCIFPFEPELLAAHGVPATYVGHPLASVIPMEPDRAAARLQLGLADGACVVAVLPGSRGSEVQQMGARFFAAARTLLRSRPALQFVVPAVPPQEAAICRLADAAGLGARLQVVRGQSHTVLAACDVALVASGTATLETALYKRPMVIAYHMNRLSYWLMRGRNLMPWIGLPNILCRDTVVPELIQDAATPEALAAALEHWLQARDAAPETIAALEQRFTALHLELRRDTARLASDAIEKLLAG
ncbi:lipid-A-disaccharide synthase [Pseudorhodoferax sp. Leaf265]|uniref:lipid-A-disaccharide synthase n=1 Tax=Pseudorhodoferax sp. Leaf265 TaxID=1736315 RepID=UPI0006F3A764|nr:lipid-A-disaccharide synthase [Pseudorhodoferax sp. Leaf265]KQP18706.1 lipid-A-disaccharide synthase [Pseudorhodoferax sp. Leaf265]